MQSADAVAQVRTIEAARGAYGPMVDGENDGIALSQRNDVYPARLFRIALHEHQFTTVEVSSRFVEQAYGLEWEHMFAVQILMQAAVVVRVIPQ
jgi:hypothetical protein